MDRGGAPARKYRDPDRDTGTGQYGVRWRPLPARVRRVPEASGSVRLMPTATAPDDIVATHAQASANARPPLLVIEPLREFLDEHGIGAGEIEARPIGEGHSNVTYLIERTDAKVVLRRPPRPPLPPSAHDVLREARLLRALADTPARVPRVLAVCEDERTIGCPFYVMERWRAR